jgi:hypothetical protein
MPWYALNSKPQKEELLGQQLLREHQAGTAPSYTQIEQRKFSQSNSGTS